MSKTLVIITGGRQGLGNELAHSFSRLPETQVVITSRLSRVTSHYKCYELDLASESSIDFFCSKIKEMEFERLILINNAGVGLLAPAQQFMPEQQRLVWHVNFVGPMLLTQKLIPLMPDGSSVINILSVLSFRPIQYWSQYSAAKSAFSNWSLGLSEEIPREKISVLNVYPGKIATDFTLKSLGDPELRENFRPSGITASSLASKILRRFKQQPYGHYYGSLSVYGFAMINAISPSLCHWILKHLIKNHSSS